MILEVLYRDERRVGRLADEPASGRIFFQYDAAWLEQGIELSPLHLPNSLGTQLVGHHDRFSFQGLFGVFADSLPLGWGSKLLDRRLQAAGLNPRKVGSLVRLGFLGDRALGALSYRPDADPAAAALHEIVALAQLDEEARRFAAGEAEGGDLATLIAAGTSPGGARPKVLALVRGKQVRFEPGTRDGWEPWIIKLTEGEHAQGGRIEFAYAHLAAAAGLSMPPVRLFDGRYFGVRRFDRVADGKVHLHTLGGLLHAADGSYEDLARAAVELTRDTRVLQEVIRRTAFNVGAMVRDDHLLNVAFLLRGPGDWSLAPCYDLTPNDPARVPAYHAMSVNGTAQPVGRDILKMAAEFGVGNGREILDEVCAAFDRWGEFADMAGLARKPANAVAQLLEEGRGLLVEGSRSKSSRMPPHR